MIVNKSHPITPSKVAEGFFGVVLVGGILALAGNTVYDWSQRPKLESLIRNGNVRVTVGGLPLTQALPVFKDMEDAVSSLPVEIHYRTEQGEQVCKVKISNQFLKNIYETAPPSHLDVLSGYPLSTVYSACDSSDTQVSNVTGDIQQFADWFSTQGKATARWVEPSRVAVNSIEYGDTVASLPSPQKLA